MEFAGTVLNGSGGGSSGRRSASGRDVYQSESSTCWDVSVALRDVTTGWTLPVRVRLSNESTSEA